MQLSGHSYQLGVISFTVLLTLSSSSVTDCRSYQTGTLGKYRYPMKKLEEDVISFQFSVNVMKYAYITLSPVARDTTDQYEIAIGNSDQANTAAIRRCRQCADKRYITTRYRLLNFNEFKLFWVKFESGTIQFGRYNESALLSWTDLYPLNIKYIGIATGVGYSGDFIFCDDRFQSRLDFSMEGMFGLFVFFLPVILLFMKFLWKQITKTFKHSNISSNDESTDSSDDFVTIRGIYNPSWSGDPDLPSYEKCMEEEGYRLRHIGEGVSTSSGAESPPSYESVMANCLINGQRHFNNRESSIDSCTQNRNSEELETYV